MIEEMSPMHYRGSFQMFIIVSVFPLRDPFLPTDLFSCRYEVDFARIVPFGIRTHRIRLPHTFQNDEDCAEDRVLRRSQ